MTKLHRQMLSELAEICNSLGSDLDGTATPEVKYKDRQKGLMKVYHVLYGILTDSPENDSAEDDMDKAKENLKELKALQNKKYTDRNG